MSGVQGALEGAILNALTNNPDVVPLLGEPLRVLDSGSPRPAFPYLEIARHSSEARGGVNVEMSEHRIDLVVVSRAMGGAEAKAIISAVRAAVTAATLTMEGWHCVLLVPLFSDATREKVGLWRALLRLKAVVQAI